MNTSTTQARNFRPKLSKIAMVIALASAMGGSGMTPAFGAEQYDRGRDAQGRGQNVDRNWQAERNRQADRDRRDYRHRNPHPYRYAQPVYVPPPVYYAPQPSAGISLFFPIDLR